MKKIIFTLIMYGVVLLVLILGSYIAGKLYLDHYHVLNSDQRNLPGHAVAYQENEYTVFSRPQLLSFIPRSQFQFSGSGFETEYKINSLGVRGNEINSHVKGSKQRIIFLGDSQTEGHGVELNQRFTTLLETEFEKEKIEIINLSIQGASPIYYAANLDSYLKLNPDGLVLILFDNDLYEDRQREHVYRRLPYPVIKSDGQVNVLKSVFNTMVQSIQFPSNEFETLIEENSPSIPTNTTQESLNKISSSLIETSLFELHWRKTQRYLDYIVKQARQQDIDIHISYLTLENLSPLKDEVYHNHSKTMGQYVSTYAQEKGISYFSFVEPVTVYYAHQNPDSLTIKGDGHASVQGHEFIKAHLVNWLRDALDLH